LEARKSLSKGGSIIALNVLQKIKEKRRKTAEDQLRKAERALKITENKLTEALRQRGVQARKDEVARKAFLK
jgi:hypothetical protein